VLGAGGSARAAVWALLDAGAAQVSIYNRTRERAQQLARELGADVAAQPAPADVLVNCTSVGLSAAEDELAQLALGEARLGDYALVVDLAYRAGDTQLVRAARERAVRTVDGLDVLVAQGALSLELWTGRKAPLDVMRAGARGA
jgi:shikimate dehydrogenase